MAVKSKSATPFGKFERTLAVRYVMGSSIGVTAISIISFVCILLAISAMIFIMSVMNGFRGQLISSILGAQGHVHVQTVSDEPPLAEVRELAEWLNQQEGVDIAFPVLNKQGFVTANGRGSGGLVKGVSPADLERLDFVNENVEYGDFSAFGVGDYGGDVIGIGRQMAATLGVRVGDTVTIISPTPRVTAFGSSLTRKPYRIGAIFSLGYADADSLYVYMPMEQALLFFGQGAASDEIEVRLDDPDDVVDFARHVRANSPRAVYVSDWKDRAAQIAGALRVEQVAMRSIFTVVVIISVFPIVAAMIMLVKNKVRDVAILRTVGTTRGSILRIFLTSGIVIGVFGTLAGLSIGLLICHFMGPIQGSIESLFDIKFFPEDIYQLSGGILPVEVVPSEVVSVALTGFFASVLATVAPSIWASLLDPVEAFRNE